jgi:hypothetical protein
VDQPVRSDPLGVTRFASADGIGDVGRHPVSDAAPHRPLSCSATFCVIDRRIVAR